MKVLREVAHARRCQNSRTGMLTEVAKYYERLRYERAANNAVVFGLSFDDSSAFLASGTSVGHLTIHASGLKQTHETQTDYLRPQDASTNVSQKSTLCHFDLSSDGAINALVSNASSLFIATDATLREFPWTQIETASTTRLSSLPRSLISDNTQVNALTRMHSSDIIFAATSRGTILRVDQRLPKVETVVDENRTNAATPLCLSASPVDNHAVVMVRSFFPTIYLAAQNVAHCS